MPDFQKRTKNRTFSYTKVSVVQSVTQVVKLIAAGNVIFDFGKGRTSVEVMLTFSDNGHLFKTQCL